MKVLWWFWGIAAALAVIFFVILIYCFCVAFYAPRRKKVEAYPLPPQDIYKPYHAQMLGWMKELEAMPREEMVIQSFDGLKLHGYFYKHSDGAPIELMFPGYRSNAKCDLSGAVLRCFALGHSALIVDQRACGRSEGHIISFGVNESRDCEAWIAHMIKIFGPDVKILMTGISMGAATVLITAGKELPKNVVGALADCGYSSAKEIIQKAIAEMKLPPTVFYPFVRLAGKIFGGFDVEEASPVKAMTNSSIPVLFAHGAEDDMVPCCMSRQMYDKCISPKKLLIVPGAGHCLCYPVDKEAYIAHLKAFWTEAKIYD